MTPDDWDDCCEPQAMLEFLRDSGRASDRKLRLFTAACWRRVSHRAGAYLEARACSTVDDAAAWRWLAAACATVPLSDFEWALSVCDGAARESADGVAYHCHLLRDLHGNPFRPLLLPTS